MYPTSYLLVNCYELAVCALFHRGFWDNKYELLYLHIR